MGGIEGALVIMNQVMYGSVESYYIPETNIPQYVNYTGTKILKNLPQNLINFMSHKILTINSKSFI